MEERGFLPFAKAGYTALSCVLCGMGVWLTLRPTLSAAFIGMAVGCVMIALGVVKIFGYFSRDLYQLAFQHDLAYGILLAALGALLVLGPRRDLNVLCIVLGIAVLSDGLFKMQTAIDAKRFGLPKWQLILALGILAGASGALLAFRPSGDVRTETVLLGVALLLEGALGLCVARCAIRIFHRPAEQEQSGLK